MKRIYFFILVFTTCVSVVFGQKDTKAQAILDKTAAAYQKAGGIALTFGGTQKGTLLLKGSCFYLDCAGIKSWFDGKTQWSYAQQNEEVTVSNPSAEELQSVNPYALITSYKALFNYRYTGTKTRNGKQGQEIVLTPRQKGEIKSITLSISTNYEPIYIGVQLSNGNIQDFNITSYQTHRNLNITNFRFDAKKYPNAEIIDMR
ncbi:uncharacterized protein BN461_01151 [Bacteroides sp. CAG:1076]|nr:uncharacterized protein BN461_01151 [Bacteroides sp. CAG:1076]